MESLPLCRAWVQLERFRLPRRAQQPALAVLSRRPALHAEGVLMLARVVLGGVWFFSREYFEVSDSSAFSELRVREWMGVRFARRLA